MKVTTSSETVALQHLAPKETVLVLTLALSESRALLQAAWEVGELLMSHPAAVSHRAKCALEQLSDALADGEAYGEIGAPGYPGIPPVETVEVNDDGTALLQPASFDPGRVPDRATAHELWAMVGRLKRAMEDALATMRVT